MDAASASMSARERLLGGIQHALEIEPQLLIDVLLKHRRPLEPVFELDLGGVEGLHRLASVALDAP
jgi:hypothetical protein